MRKRVRWWWLIGALFLASCVTVNIYFPAAAVQKAADAIVEDVRGKETKEEQKLESKPDKGTWFLRELRKVSLGPAEVVAAEIDVEVTTPAIRALKESMKSRYPLLKPFYERGAVGESNAGLLESRDLGSLNLKEKSDLLRLVEQENKDRQSLYAEIVKANKFGPEVLPRIQKIFANSWRGQSQRGWWIQNDSGEWQKK